MSALWAGKAGEGQARGGAPCLLGCRKAWADIGRSEGHTLPISEGRTFQDHRTSAAAAELGVPGRSGTELMWVRGD